MSAAAFGLVPGTSMEAAANVIAGESAGIRAVPVLPQRGVTGDVVAHTLSWLPDLPVDIGPRAWRVCARPQNATRALYEQRATDLDALEAAWGSTPACKIQVCGPWTLASAVELSNGHRILSDPAATADLFAMYAQALEEYSAVLTQRFGVRKLKVHVLEPATRRIAEGSIPGTSQLDPIAAHSPKHMGERLHELFEAWNRAGMEMMLDQGSRPLIEVVQVAAPATLVLHQRSIAGFSHAELDRVGTWLGTGHLAHVGDGDERSQAKSVSGLMRTLGYSPAQATEALMMDDPQGASGLSAAARRIAAAREAAHILHETAGEF
ncbi:uroporphyrinogen decarboxylase/cobalamine-independent methonine synthase family protein [Corynebacterium gerontici]|uniref:Methionine synthase n=1 Tax=Corynebacterium gerontici TaxID=2079234 RepID=A0A3G6IZY1_9CORY|nr:hypothetical protein [Corynebacterium gerontici]AZA11262.1 hypothetical protein CGERO_04730 [Corynebacterium gerontici]